VVVASVNSVETVGEATVEDDATVVVVTVASTVKALIVDVVDTDPGVTISGIVRYMTSTTIAASLG
jgi:hypothetical protein